MEEFFAWAVTGGTGVNGLTTMGESALLSHMAGSKHQASVKSNATTSTVVLRAAIPQQV